MTEVMGSVNASMDVIPLLGIHILTHILIDELRGVSRCVWIIGVHGTLYTTPKTEAKSVPGVITLPMTHHWSVVCSVSMLSP